MRLYDTIKSFNKGVMITLIIFEEGFMASTSQETNEWVDGFLFVANRPILDFLNTKPVLLGEPTELLPDARALERWLIASKVVTSPRARALVRGWRDSAEAAAFVRELTTFRERLRAAVAQIESGSLPTDAFIAEVNFRLREHPRGSLLIKRGQGLAKETLFEPHKPEDLWEPIADATAELLTEAEPSRIRQCESCVVHFFDTSKKGSRRWCSMNICGNKLKVAAYQRRKRAAQALPLRTV
jgi:predicted RNA-binding Zn ribbon-like protein